MPRANKSLPSPSPKKKPGAVGQPPRKGRKAVAKTEPVAAASSPKLISPSRIARYFFQECPRYLRYTSTPKDLWAAEGVPEPPFDHSPVTTAILEGGYTWEEEVVANRLRGRLFIAGAKADTRLKDRVWGASETRRILAGLKPGEAIYQPTLITPPSFYKRYGIDGAIVEMTDCRPDLIVCEASEDGPFLRIVDIKASPGLKLSHRIQAALYTLILRHVMEDWGDDRLRIDDRAGIWLAQADESEVFDTRSIRPPLENFLEREVQPLLERPADQAPWHVYYRCEWCPFFDHCRTEMARTDDVSRVPYLSTYAKQFLNSLDPPVRTLADFEKVLDDPERLPVLNDCASLRGRADRLRLQARAMRDGRVRVHEGATLAMPRGENIRLVITVQAEPVSGQVYAYGIVAQGLREVLGENPKPMVNVARSPHPECSAELEREFVRALYGLLRPVHDFNASAHEWNLQKSLQAYTYDTYERDRLSEVLLRRVADPAVAEEALQVFFHFQRPELIQTQNQPSDEVVFPVVVLVDVLRDRMALPLDITYRFPDAARLLMPKQFGFAYQENDYFSFALSNQMRSDAIFAVWHQGKDEYVERIERELRNRISATGALINGIRERLTESGNSLFAWPPKFKLPSAFDYRHPSLSRLAFIARHESILSYLGVRELRMAPLAERLQDAETLRLTYLGDDRFRLDPSQKDASIEEDSFPNWILTEETGAGNVARLSFDDYAWKDRLYAPSNLPIALAGIRGVGDPEDASRDVLRLEVKPGRQFPPLRPESRYLLEQRFTDFTIDKVLAHLAELDRQTDDRFVGLIERPHEAGRPLDVPAAIRGRALELARLHGMTSSQLSAFEGILDHGLRLVWGPPGTGKTHFLALSILCLAEAHRAAGRPFRTMMTAFTHAAIDNALRKAFELQGRLRIVRGDFPIHKLDKSKSRLAGMEGVLDLPAKVGKTGWGWSAKDPVSLYGGTVWSIHKGEGADRADLIVVDEGSQLRVPEAAIVLGRLGTGTRLLIAGDDKQLPPIIQAAYPDPEEGEPILHRSIFACWKAQAPDRQDTATLLENWRMSRTLCLYPAEQIYTSDYRSAGAEIASRRLALAKPSIADKLADDLLDPDYPLVIAVLDGVRATVENRIEADLVARAAVRLRDRLQAGPRRRYPDTLAGDAAFWKDGLFVVSPHHIQIKAIRRALKTARSWHGAPFVETVDRMQGQECEVVIVSYGVSDVEHALNEKEFIYSLNRLNVSITRARTKTIVFLPRPLIEPPMQVYEDDRLCEGVAFMQGLVQFAEHRGEALRYPQPEAGELRVFRVRSS
ncbi:MAG: AAA domain-containing protein [Isosphaeraceae bacterium]